MDGLQIVKWGECVPTIQTQQVVLQLVIFLTNNNTSIIGLAYAGDNGTLWKFPEFDRVPVLEMC
jgi:Tfp pilus tip-associated adhesin PilY1